MASVKFKVAFCVLQLPVACKSCPCGHVFISKKLQDKTVTEGEGRVESKFCVANAPGSGCSKMS